MKMKDLKKLGARVNTKTDKKIEKIMEVVSFCLFVILVTILFLGIRSYNNDRNMYSADGYYVRIKANSKCAIVRTAYRDRLGLAPLILDDNCVRDIKNLKKGDLPHLD